MHKRKAFTIIELLIVIAVIAVIATVIIISYSTVSSKATVANLQAYLNTASKQIQLDYASSGQYPASAAQINSGSGLKTNPNITVSYAVDNTPGSQKYCVTARSGTTVYSIDADSPPTAGVGACSLISLTNMLTNSDYTNGTTGWYGDFGTVSASSNTLTATANGSGSYLVSGQNCSNCAVAGNKIYGAIKQRVTNSSANSIGIMISDPDSNKYPIIYNAPTMNNWYSGGGVVTLTKSGSISFKPFQIYSSSAIASGKVMEQQYAMMIDLTSTFGAGNEPSSAQIATILAQLPNSWFDGTISINIAGIL